MPEWKDTVNLPRTDFPMKANLQTVEPEWLARWQAMGLYGKIRESRKGRPKFVLHDGPPYVIGYDCHGLPIELKVDRELGPKKRGMSVADFCRACRAYAERFIDAMSREFQRLLVM